MTWALWRFAKHPMTCGFCRNAQEAKWRESCQGIDHVEECPTKEVQKLAPANHTAVELFYKMLPGLQNGMGGWDYGAIREVFGIYRVSKGERPVLFDKVLIMIRAIMQIQETSKQ